MIRPVQRELFAVIGNPVSHSLSPTMMDSAFKSLGIPAVYLAFQVDSLGEDLQTLARLGLRGLSVTLPHKETAFRLADEVDATAEAIGAVNTLRLRNGRWEGLNTDWVGSNRALEQAVDSGGKRALVIGAGGVARAVVYGLMRNKAFVTVANRTAERGEALAKTFGCNFVPLRQLSVIAREGLFDIVIQCTSVGLWGTESSAVVSEPLFRPGMVVLDTVYRPRWTPFLLAAKSAGCTVIPGLDMLLYQGVAQLEWWLERTIPLKKGVEIMREALSKALENEEHAEKD